MTTPLNKWNSYYQHIHEVGKNTYQFVVTDGSRNLVKSQDYPSLEKCNEACTLKLYELHGLQEVDPEQVVVDNILDLLLEDTFATKEVVTRNRKKNG